MNEEMNDILKARKRETFADFRDFVLQLFLYKFMSNNKSEFYSIEQSLSDLSTNITEENAKELMRDAFVEAELSVTGKEADAVFADIFHLKTLKQMDNTTICDVVKAMTSVEVNEGMIAWFIDYSAKSTGIFGGEHTTPTCLCELVSELASVNKNGGTIADLSCGTAGMICSTGKRLGADSYTIMDSSREAIIQAIIRLVISKVPIEKICSVINDAIMYNVDKKFDVQVSNPPYALHWSGDESLLEDERYKKYGVLPPKSFADMLFIENIIEHMSDNGKAVMICNMTPLTMGGKVSIIRKKIMDMDILDAVIKIPRGCLISTEIPVYILIFEKGRKQKDVYFMDASTFFTRGRKYTTITPDGIDTIVGLYKAREDRKDICYKVSKKDIEKAGNMLNTESYVDRKKVLRLLKKEKLVPLSSVVSVLKPKRIKEKGRVLNAGAAKYPLEYDRIKEEEASDVCLQKGDIIFRMSMMEMMYLVDEEPKETLYASSRDIVIRPNKIQSEYLFLFFESEIGQQIFSIVCPSIVGRTRIKHEKLEYVDIPLPQKDQEEYRRIFEIENHLRIDISAYNTLLANRDKYVDSDTIEDVLNQELALNVKTCKTETMQLFLADDIKELNLCFKAKAYKATLVLAGSILEAILIDWMSEIKGVDYFNTDYYVIKKDYRTGKEFKKRADLIDYINEIKYIEKPNWVDEANKAHKIREKRNLVHAKLGISSDDINEHTCRMVISYLKDVIISRGIEE